MGKLTRAAKAAAVKASLRRFPKKKRSPTDKPKPRSRGKASAADARAIKDRLEQERAHGIRRGRKR